MLTPILEAWPSRRQEALTRHLPQIASGRQRIYVLAPGHILTAWPPPRLNDIRRRLHKPAAEPDEGAPRLSRVEEPRLKSSVGYAGRLALRPYVLRVHRIVIHQVLHVFQVFRKFVPNYLKTIR